MIHRQILWLLIAGTLTAGQAQALSVPSAKQAMALAGTGSQSSASAQLIRLEGGYSDSDLRPRQWDMTLYDATRGNNATVIRVKDGAVVSRTGAVRLFDDARLSRFGRNFTGYDAGEIINLQRWKLDSPEALTKALALPVLTNVQVTEVRLTLRKLSDGDVPPVWRVMLRARSHADPHRAAWIGYVDVSAENGEVLANETRVERLLR